MPLQITLHFSNLQSNETSTHHTKTKTGDCAIMLTIDIQNIGPLSIMCSSQMIFVNDLREGTIPVDKHFSALEELLNCGKASTSR